MYCNAHSCPLFLSHPRLPHIPTLCAGGQGRGGGGRCSRGPSECTGGVGCCRGRSWCRAKRTEHCGDGGAACWQWRWQGGHQSGRCGCYRKNKGSGGQGCWGWGGGAAGAGAGAGERERSAVEAAGALAALDDSREDTSQVDVLWRKATLCLDRTLVIAPPLPSSPPPYPRPCLRTQRPLSSPHPRSPPHFPLSSPPHPCPSSLPRANRRSPTMRSGRGGCRQACPWS